MILVLKNVFSKSGKFRYLYQFIDNDKTRFKSISPIRWALSDLLLYITIYNYLDIINALENVTMPSVNSSE